MTAQLTRAEQIDLIMGTVDLLADPTVSLDQRQRSADDLVHFVTHGTADIDRRAVLVIAMMRYSALFAERVESDVLDATLWGHAPIVDRGDDNGPFDLPGIGAVAPIIVDHAAIAQLHDEAEQHANGPWCPVHGRVGATIDGRCGRCFGIEGR